MEKVIYEPFNTLEDQEASELRIKNEIESDLSEKSFSGTEEDLLEIQKHEDNKSILQDRMEEKLINLN